MSATAPTETPTAMYKTLDPVEDVLEVALGGAAAVAVGSCLTMSVAGAMLELRADELVGR